MKLLLLVTTSLLIISGSGQRCDCNESKQKAYILTAPTVFDSGSTETVCIALLGIYSNGIVKVKIDDSNKSIVDESYTIQNGESKCFKIKVPVIKASTATLHVNGNFGNDYSFSGNRIINIRKTADIVLIQTDKLVYKVDQLVRFRILHLTSDLLPSAKQIKLVTIEDPNKSVVYEIDKPLPKYKYIYEVSYKLSNRPKLGNWTIYVEDEDKTRKSKIFIVQDYTLPKFNVDITPPLNVLPNFRKISYKVCVEYNYEEPVIGKLRTNVTFTSTLNNVQPLLRSFNTAIDGCTTVKFDKNIFGEINFPQFDFVHFYAEVTEKETGHKKSSIISKQLRPPTTIYFVTAPFFKPGLPYNLKIYVEDVNGWPVASEPFSIQVRVFNSLQPIGSRPTTTIITTNKGGIGLLSIPEQDQFTQSIKINIVAKKNPKQPYYYFGLKKPLGIIMPKTVTETIKPWHSPSHSYIKIEGLPSPLKCNNKAVFRIYLTNSAIAHINSHNLIVHYQSSVKIQQSQLVKEKSQSYFELAITVDPKLSPKLEILVYYITPRKEIVSDSDAFIVEKCLEHKPEMNFTQSKVPPGSQTTLKLKAAPNSICSIYMTDKSVQIFPQSQFNPYRIFHIFDRTPVIRPAATDTRSCSQSITDQHLGKLARNPNIFQARVAFDMAGLLTVSDLAIELNPCRPEQVGTGARQMQNVKEYEELTDDMEVEALQDVYENVTFPVIDENNFFPETWLWELVPIDNNGQATLTREVPRSMTKWIGNAFCLSESVGLGVSPPAALVSHQEDVLYLFLHLPETAIKGETVTAAVTIKGHSSKCIPIQIVLSNNQQFALVDGLHVAKFCVCGKTPYTHKYHLQLNSGGKVNVSVSMSTLPTNVNTCSGPTKEIWTYNTISKSIKVQLPALPKETTQSSWICATGNPTTQHFELKIPATATRDLPVKTRAMVTGDVMTPTIVNMNALVYHPGGCAEQTMRNFAPLVYVMIYLRSTNQLKTLIEKSAKSQMEKGFKNEMKYRLSDGSFEVWGRPKIGGSVWLTAFVIKSFVSARKIITIEPHIISSGINFIVKKQLANGCFVENINHKSHHNDIKGGYGQGENSVEALTLYVTIALLESSYTDNNVITKAFQCIAKDKNPTNFRLAMKAYATALAGKTAEAEALITTLERKSNHYGNSIYWTNGAKSSIEVNIETTAYVLLAISTLRHKYVELGSQVAKWLISQRNGHGGFKSTQDTVLGVQALEMFTIQISTKSTDMTVKIKSENKVETVTVHGANRLATKNLEIRNNVVDVLTTGKGCVLIQFTTKYYEGGTHLAKELFVDVTVKRTPGATNKFTKKTLHICVRYQGSEAQSNMAIVDVRLPSGYEIDSKLDDLKRLGINLGNWEYKKCRVILYFSSITKKLTCFDLAISETSKVENRQKSIISIYDYYRPELESSLEYSVE